MCIWRRKNRKTATLLQYTYEVFINLCWMVTKQEIMWIWKAKLMWHIYLKIYRKVERKKEECWSKENLYIQTILGTSVSNSSFQLRYTELNIDDFSLLQGWTFGFASTLGLRWGSWLLNYFLMSFLNTRCNYTSLISLLLNFFWKFWWCCQCHSCDRVKTKTTSGLLDLAGTWSLPIKCYLM